MAKKVTEKIKDLYEYISDQNKRQLLRGQAVTPLVYAVVFKKNDFNMLPFPIQGYETPGGREELLKKMTELLQKENWKVKMFMYASEALVKFKKKGVGEKNCLLISGRDCYDFVRREMLEIVKGDKIELKNLPIYSCGDGWEIARAEKYEDELLSSIWEGYRKMKKG